MAIKVDGRSIKYCVFIAMIPFREKNCDTSVSFCVTTDSLRGNIRATSHAWKTSNFTGYSFITTNNSNNNSIPKRRRPVSLCGKLTRQWIDQSHKSHNALDKYPTMHHFVTEMCTHVHISATKCCIVGYGTGAFWDLWDGSIEGGVLNLRSLTHLSLDKMASKLQMITLNAMSQWKLVNFDNFVIYVVLWGVVDEKSSLVPRQAIMLTGPVQRRI